MTQPDTHQNQKPIAESSLEKNMAKGLGVDVFFGVVLLILSTFISNFGIAWMITMGIVIGLWVLWHIFKRGA